MTYSTEDLESMVAAKEHEPLWDAERRALYGNHLLVCLKDSAPAKGEPGHHRLGGMDEASILELARKVVHEEREGLLIADERPPGQRAPGPHGAVRLIVNEFERVAGGWARTGARAREPERGEALLMLEVLRQLEREPRSDLDYYLESAE